MPTLFERIIAREIPARIEHEDEHCIVIHDIQPQAPVHLLIIPKVVIPRVGDATPDHQAVLGHLLLAAGVVAKKLQLARGFRLVVNHGPDACETVPHLHVHLLARRQLNWPPPRQPRHPAAQSPRRPVSAPPSPRFGFLVPAIL
ncbi:MAG: histidine triad nucleotide-binding protein [Opitutaceae bacterium]|nr:histidine triad nucleotide-binding protein [Opitutaceae bacterium]